MASLELQMSKLNSVALSRIAASWGSCPSGYEPARQSWAWGVPHFQEGDQDTLLECIKRDTVAWLRDGVPATDDNGNQGRVVTTEYEHDGQPLAVFTLWDEPRKGYVFWTGWTKPVLTWFGPGERYASPELALLACSRPAVDW